MWLLWGQSRSCDTQAQCCHPLSLPAVTTSCQRPEGTGVLQSRWQRQEIFRLDITFRLSDHFIYTSGIKQNITPSHWAQSFSTSWRLNKAYDAVISSTLAWKHGHLWTYISLSLRIHYPWASAAIAMEKKPVIMLKPVITVNKLIPNWSGIRVSGCGWHTLCEMFEYDQTTRSKYYNRKKYPTIQCNSDKNWNNIMAEKRQL